MAMEDIKDPVEPRPILWIVRGPPGAGKDHFVEKTLMVDRGVEHQFVFTADDFFLEPAGMLRLEGEALFRKKGSGCYRYIFDPTRIAEAHANTRRDLMRSMFLHRNEPHVVHNNFTAEWEYREYMDLAQVLGFRYHVVDIMPVTVDEIQLCQRRCVHKVPDDILYRRCVEFKPHAHSVNAPAYTRISVSSGLPVTTL